MHLLVAPRKDAEHSSFTRDAGVQQRWVSLCATLRNLSAQLPIKMVERIATVPGKLKFNATLLTWQQPCLLHSRTLGISSLQRGLSLSLPMLCLKACWLHTTSFLKMCFRNVTRASLRAMTQCLTLSHSQDTTPPNHSIQPRHTPRPQEAYKHTLTGNTYLYSLKLPLCSCAHISATGLRVTYRRDSTGHG